MIATNQLSYDVVVMGGGPAGSTAASLLAQRGRRVLVLERMKFPRFHIGESLMPDTYWALRRIGVLDKMKSSHFTKKYSVQFVSHSGKESAPFYFDEVNPHESSQTWQVRRSEFDEMLLNHAASCGAEVRQETNVAEVHFAPPTAAGRFPRATGVTFVGPDGVSQKVSARVVVDATGANALIGRQLDLRRPDPKLKKAAVFGHFKGAYRDEGRNAGATLVLNVQNQDGWFWYIPLHDDITSVGVVADASYLIANRGPIEQVLDEEIARCPALGPRLSKAERVGPVHVLSDYSYNSKVCAGDGWVLIGDAFTFLDPIYSSGVHLALKSGELASDAIEEGLRTGDLSAEKLGAWGDSFYAGLQSIRKMVYIFYTRGFSFGRFMRENPTWRKQVTDLLVGDVFKPGADDVFEIFRKYCELPEPIALEHQPAAT